ncbi:hypothetical protein HR12_24910 [Microbacterium sp. SUBG005]|nr:hypothetical protein HR12_24910 [Microbacterium sp. SUBG005]
MQATALYKAKSGGDSSYRGTDPDAYDDVFDQKAGALYESELARLTQLFYEDGNATEILNAWSTTLKNGASDLVDSDTITAETEDLAAAFDVASGNTGD